VSSDFFINEWLRGEERGRIGFKYKEAVGNGEKQMVDDGWQMMRRDELRVIQLVGYGFQVPDLWFWIWGWFFRVAEGVSAGCCLLSHR